MPKRRVVLGGPPSADIAEGGEAQAAMAVAQDTGTEAAPAPLVWPVVTPQSGIRSFAGHTDTVLDVVGRLGTPPSLVIFSEGNHLMVLLSDAIIGAFPSWAKSQPQHADLELGNIVVVTLPQPIIVEMLRTGGLTLGNLTLDVSRASGFYPDIVMGYPDPLRALRQLGVTEPLARFFCQNRGLALLVRTGNPLGIHGLADVAGSRARLALPEDVGAVRATCRAAADALLDKPAAEALFAAEIASFPGRLGIMHRDLPEMVARGYADVALTWYHLVAYWARLFPDNFALVPVSGAERFYTQIAFGRVADPLRARAMQAFDEFFFSRAQDVYPRYEFARMSEEAFGALVDLD
jgi:extracellular solute-binding protein